ncbi:Chemotaxis signal transduction protein (plasmid) [Alteromonas macleodii]|nr:Chemotaxis signal transduction protein [Alteromonas macleodii]VTP58123.1 Chemotaxis signal transduction protein [Alteromonas macleodii]
MVIRDIIVNKKTEEFFSVKVKNLAIAIPIHHVVEVQLAVNVIETLSTNNYFDCAFNCRGNFIPVFDIRKRLGLGTSAVSRSHYFLVLKCDEMRFSIMIDEIIGTISLVASELHKMNTLTTKYGAPLLIKLSSDAVSICDLSTLITSDIKEEFYELMFDKYCENDSSKEKTH